VSKSQDAQYRDGGDGGAGAPLRDAAGQPVSRSAAAEGAGTAGAAGGQGIAVAITEVSERATLLIREEIELAKAEVAEKANRLVKGAIVGVAAGIFIVTALFFVLIGLAWLLYYYLPIGSDFTYFWGFFAMALILLVLGLFAGLIAARAVKRGAPPTPNIAIEEARKIRETVASSADIPGADGPGAYVPHEEGS
jgi:uncharacterized membrane protein YqjE